MAKKLELSFTTDQGKTMTLSLADPKEGLTKAETEAVMTTMIAKAALTGNNGTIATIKACAIQTTDKVALV